VIVVPKKNFLQKDRTATLRELLEGIRNYDERFTPLWPWIYNSNIDRFEEYKKRAESITSQDYYKKANL